MVERREATIARILTKDRRILGTGFLINPKFVFTCFHVIEPLINKAAIIFLDFPFSKTPAHSVEIVGLPETKDNREENDWAVLTINEDVIAPKLDLLSHVYPDNKATTYGFPKSRAEGLWEPDIFITAELADGMLQFESNKDLEPGY